MAGAADGVGGAADGVGGRADDTALLVALGNIRERGAIGESSLTSAVAHADRFVDRLPLGISSLADIGSGGGLPGLVIAWRRPHLRIALIDRRSARTDQLRRAVTALGLAMVEVIHADVRDVAETAARFDVVTARSFGPVDVTIACAAALLTESGVVLISEPPAATKRRWDRVDVQSVGLEDCGARDGIREFHRRSGLSPRCST